MSEAKEILLVLGPAIVTGVIGYHAAMLQVAVSALRIRAEEERLVEQRRDHERRRRFTSYREFLSLLHRLDAMVAGFAPLSRSSFEEWLEAYQRLYGALDLTASDRVRTEAANVKATLDSIGIQARLTQTREPFERQFAHLYLEGRGSLALDVEELQKSMRLEAGFQPTSE